MSGDHRRDTHDYLSLASLGRTALKGQEGNALHGARSNRSARSSLLTHRESAQHLLSMLRSVITSYVRTVLVLL